LNWPLGAITALLHFLIRTSAKKESGVGERSMGQTLQSLDLFGFITFAPAVVMCLIAMEWGGTIYAWSSPQVLGQFCGSFIAFAVFLLGQYYKGDAAMIPLKILSQKSRVLWILDCRTPTGGLVYVGIYSPVWFQVVKGATPLHSGVFILPTVISQIISAGISGMLGTSDLEWTRIGLTRHS
jgi:hypothetical protein